MTGRKAIQNLPALLNPEFARGQPGGLLGFNSICDRIQGQVRDPSSYRLVNVLRWVLLITGLPDTVFEEDTLLRHHD